MKTHLTKKAAPLKRLMKAISLLQNEKETMAFFTDLCTPAELEAMSDRWEVVPLLQAGIPYREISEKTGVSVTTITRVARFLTMGDGGYALIAERMDES